MEDHFSWLKNIIFLMDFFPFLNYDVDLVNLLHIIWLNIYTTPWDTF